MKLCPPACAVCRDCPVAPPHYCDYENRRLARAHESYLRHQGRLLIEMGLVLTDDEPVCPPASGYQGLFQWGERTYRELNGLAQHAIDHAAADEAGRVIANMPKHLVEALWVAFVQRGDREDWRRPPDAPGRPSTKRPLPDLLADAEREYTRRVRHNELSGERLITA